MKKRLVSMAVGAALAGGAVTAHAVNVNPDGHGQALIYPFYTVEGGYDTYISITNVTNQTKAVKVRFLEAMNSEEVLDFNLYLSPFDIWTGVISADDDGAAVLRTTDTSCTVPAIPAGGEAFRDTLFEGDSVSGPERTREGYVEIIEMGVVVGAKGAAAVHDAGVGGEPANCGLLREAWNVGGAWRINRFDEMLPPTGGLYGFGVLINVENGTDATYDALALDGFSATIQHTDPGDVFPTLADANPPVARVFDQGEVIEANFLDGAEAVSAVLMFESVFNDVVLDEAITAGTDWVLNFPTKRFFTNPPEVQARAPFTRSWDPDASRACEEITVRTWDREEEPDVPDLLDFSPRPEFERVSLCYEVNVMSWEDSGVLASSDRVTLPGPFIFENGWSAISFIDPNNRLVSLEGFVFAGLPVIGFAVQQYVNNTLEVDGETVLSNYQGLVNHKGLRVVTSS